MEKHFLHEMLRNPDRCRPGDSSKLDGKMSPGLWAVWRAFCYAWIMKSYAEEQLGIPIKPYTGTAYIPQDIFRKALIDHGLPPDHFMPAIEGFCNDPAMLALGAMSVMVLPEEAPVDSYVFTKEFWPILQKTKINTVNWDSLPQKMACTMRFPVPLQDFEGDKYDEIIVVIMSREEAERCRGHRIESKRQGSRVLTAWWPYQKDAMGFVFQVIPDGATPIIPETWNPEYHLSEKFNSRISRSINIQEDLSDIEHIIKALVYVCSGRPDLRSERNPIQYRGNSTTKPVNAHKAFSTAEFKRVGWNWMKLLQERAKAGYTKDSWPVEPYGRYQAYGPRDNPTHYEHIVVTGHERKRRPELLNRTQDEIQL